MRGGRTVKARPKVVPERILTVCTVLLLNTLYTFTRTATSLDETIRNDFSARRSRWFVLGYLRAPNGSTFTTRLGMVLPPENCAVRLQGSPPRTSNIAEA